ncbi:hypothetical protein G6F32_016792 [Rhizopus arrhizus]|nr:hypothetical protein G6F32_016792 [Rhizopus arrhizus]
MDQHHGLAHLGRQGVVAHQRADLAVENDVRRGQRAHDFQRVRVAVGQRRVVFVFAVFVLGDVEVELADGVDAVPLMPDTTCQGTMPVGAQ